MVRILRRKPSYPLREVKALIRSNNVIFGRNAIRYALNDFGWNVSNIKNCLLKLNDKYYDDNPRKNHFYKTVALYKTVAHNKFPNTMMDYYKAQNIITGINLYTHFYIRPGDGKLIVDSF